MTLHTGGTAFGDISTRSRPCSSAISNARVILYTPISTLSPTSRTSGEVIFLLILC